MEKIARYWTFVQGIPRTKASDVELWSIPVVITNIACEYSIKLIKCHPCTVSHLKADNFDEF